MFPKAPVPEIQAALLNIIGEVEIGKGLATPMNPQQRRALMLLLSGTGKSLEEIRDMGMSVISKNTFGSIAFEHWLERDEREITKVNIDCRYCGTQWWGLPASKCPTCFPSYYEKEKS